MTVKLDAAREAISNTEARRCAAISTGDIAALGALLLPDYVHVHANGRVTDKAGTLERVVANHRTVSRGAIDIRISGDFALAVGEQIKVMANGEVRGMVTQTLRRDETGWRFASFQITTISPG